MQQEAQDHQDPGRGAGAPGQPPPQPGHPGRLQAPLLPGALIDACTRLAWAEVVGDIKSLSVMFVTLKSINFLNAEYGIQFEAILTDNGPEMASPRNIEGHPMERMLNELGIKHRYTRPYRPQTNGKIERFWRTLNEDLLEGTTFESVAELRDELAAISALLQYPETPPGNGWKDPFGDPSIPLILSTN